MYNINNLNKAKNSKINYSSYLFNQDEPEDNISNGYKIESQAQLLEDSYFMRKKIRNLAKKNREVNPY